MLLALAGTEPAAHSRLANDPPRHAGARRPGLRQAQSAHRALCVRPQPLGCDQLPDLGSVIVFAVLNGIALGIHLGFFGQRRAQGAGVFEEGVDRSQRGCAELRG